MSTRHLLHDCSRGCSSAQRVARMLLTLLLFGVLAPTVGSAADTPDPKVVFAYKPTQKDIQVETPPAAEFPKCEVKVERRGKASGWVVYGPDGQTLRRFIDTNSDNVVDQWSYYYQGLEVYRDIDTNNNSNVDQSRWLNTAGTRWGVDTNEDGKIDSWKLISAEEAAREAVNAMLAGDEQALATLLVTPADLKALQVKTSVADEVVKNVTDVAGKISAYRRGSKVLTAKTKWMRFDSASPGLIPAEDEKAGQDLFVYENAMAIVEIGDGQAGLVQIGEMIRVGNAWKLTQVPQPLEDESTQIAAGGVLMQQSAGFNGNVTNIDGDFSPEMRQLLDELQKLDAAAPSIANGAAAVAKYNRQRADVLGKIVAASSTDEQREQWLRQLVDGLSAAVQTGQFAEGLTQLERIVEDLKKQRASKELLAYVSYRAMLSRYATDLQKAAASNEKRQEVQKWWLEQLRSFADSYPTAPESGEAMLQLAIAYEFSGQGDEAKRWYALAAKNHPQTIAGQRSAGALRRFDLEGKAIDFSGPRFGGGTINTADYRGKVVLVIYWADWCKLCTEDLPQIKALYEQYQRRGFEVVGVNLDTTADPVAGYIAEHKVPWPHVFEEGGLESAPGRQFGIVLLPTMFLVDKQGKVVSRNISVADLKNELPKLLLQ